MRVQKKYTVKEWKMFFDIQETMCKKYDIVLTDYKTKRERLSVILNQINLKNLNKGIITFNKIMQDFGGSMGQFTSELNKSSQNNIKIWSDKSEKESKQQKSKDQINLEKIWGKKK